MKNSQGDDNNNNNNNNNNNKFGHTIRLLMHNSKSVLEKELDKLLWDFDIRTDHLISARRPDLKIINNKKRDGFCV